MSETAVTPRALSPWAPSSPWRFWVPFALVAAVNLLPVWGVRWLPLVDFGGHVELIDIVMHQHDASTVYPQLYKVNLVAAPNTLSLWIARITGWVGAFPIAKLLLSLYVLGVPLATVALCRLFGRDPRLAWFSFPLLWNYMWFMGFLNYLLAMPLVLGSVAVAQHHQRHPSWKSAAGIVVLYAASFYAHMIACLIAVGMGMYTLAIGTRPRHLARALLPLSALVVASPWLYRMLFADDARLAGGKTRFMPMERMLTELFAPISHMQAGVDDMAFALLALLFAILLAFGKVRLGKVEWMALLTFAVYLCLPENIFEVNVIGQRVIPFFWWLLLLWPRDLPRRLAGVVFPAAATLAVGYAWWMHGEFRRFEEEQLAELPAALAELPDNSRLSYFDATCRDWQNNPVIKPCVGFHIPRAIHTVENHGVTNQGFAIQPTTAVQYRPGHALPGWQARFWQEPYFSLFDYHLIRTERLPGQLRGTRGLRLRAHAGNFWLFERER